MATGESIVCVHRNVYDGNFGGRSPQENNNANRITATKIFIISKQGLSFLISDTNRQIVSGFFQPGMAKLIQRFENPFPHQ
jgi:hypothetical protein